MAPVPAEQRNAASPGHSFGGKLIAANQQTPVKTGIPTADFGLTGLQCRWSVFLTSRNRSKE